jgi:hypothetical protein
VFRVKVPNSEIPDSIDGDDWEIARIILPKGYRVEKEGPNRFQIFLQNGSVPIGHYKIELSGLLFVANENSEEGAQFWVDFGKKHPHLNPARIRFGVVSETDGLFRLEGDPEPIPGNALKDIDRYAKIGNCYFVKFMTGHLEKESLQVMRMQLISSKGTLGEEMGESRLPLWGE